MTKCVSPNVVQVSLKMEKNNNTRIERAGNTHFAKSMLQDMSPEDNIERATSTFAKSNFKLKIFTTILCVKYGH